MTSSSPRALVGVDVGGTHTDALVILGDQTARGKALTTYDDFSSGLLDAVEIAAAQLNMELRELLQRTHLLVNGTTVVTNTITELRGAKVGVLVTAGFRDTFRFAGGPRKATFDDHLQTNVPDLFERRALAEIDERIDYSGNAIVPIDRRQVAAEARRLVEDVGVEAIAVCFLWSFLNPAHELAARAEISATYPDVFVTTSHQLVAVQGETRRWTTAVLNAFVHRNARSYIESVSSQLGDAGLRGSIAFFQGLGGGISGRRARDFPLALLGSGPAGGAIATKELARELGYDEVLIGDMGGTSFETGIVSSDAVQVRKNVDLGLLKTGVNVVDMISIGAGGGSVACVSDRGVPQVGPQSAGSAPGPACYGKGGTKPTVTDAMVALGFIDPTNYLNGRVPLRADLAVEALRTGLAEPFGWSVDRAAAAVHDLVVENMANAIREVTVQQGRDPHSFPFIAYGGMLPMFAAEIAERLDIPTVVIPQNSSVFCARGLVTSDFVLRLDHNVSWLLTDAEGSARVNDALARLASEGRAAMRDEGFDDSDIDITRSAEFQFLGQVFELSMQLPERDLVPGDGVALFDQFVTLYELTYGEGTAWTGVPALMLSVTITAIGRLPKPPVPLVRLEPRQSEQILKAERVVHLPSAGERRRVSIYDGAKFTAGSLVAGPAVIDEHDTTILVPTAVSARRDQHGNYILEREGAGR